jgi:membrane protease subunit HflK
VTRTIVVGVALLALLGLASSTVMVVDPNEVAVVRRFGAVDRVARAGLAFRLPPPVERDERITVTEVRRVEVSGRRLVTGDTNLVDLDLVVQFIVAEPVHYALGLLQPDEVVSAAVSSVSAAIVAGMDVDYLLTTGRSDLQGKIAASAQAALDRVPAGIHLQAVDVRELVPPSAVVDAFNDVSSAGTGRPWRWRPSPTSPSCCRTSAARPRARSRRREATRAGAWRARGRTRPDSRSCWAPGRPTPRRSGFS